jgi:site-specific recombinase XerD
MEIVTDNGTFWDVTSTTPALLPSTTGTHSGDIQALVDAAKAFAGNSKAPNTWKAYKSDWRGFAAWCRSSGFVSLPARPEAVALYVSHLASLGRKTATTSRHLVSISQAHRLAGFPSPTSTAQVTETMKGIRRSLGVRQQQKAPVYNENLRAMVQDLGHDLLSLRDRALLLTGFATAARRSELVNLNVEDLSFVADGVMVVIQKSKTDQEGHGHTIGVPSGSSPITCPVRALRAWLEAADLKTGPVFRPVGRWGRVSTKRLSAKAVARLVKKYVEAIGFDARSYGAHSLRSGLASSAARAGRSEASIMRITGHKSVNMVRRYIRAGSLFLDCASAGLL